MRSAPRRSWDRLWQTGTFTEHVFGVVGLNDWSARDIPAWEYVPLGPFLGKSFLTSILAWVTPFAALRPALVPAPNQDPPVARYLQVEDLAAYDITVKVELNGVVISRPLFRSMYWTPPRCWPT